MTDTHLPDWVKTELLRVPAATARGLVETAPHARAVAARYDARKKLVVVELANGASFAFPPQLAQGLSEARSADLAVIELSPLGTGLHWPRLDADLTVEGLLVGVFGSRAWMRQHAARAGRATSEAKTAAARANGAKGGRPRKALA
jgi:uncharacterized protein RhaS with RHS repeats